ncbi:MAG: ABC transporter permease [Candidatus Omnitrophica bacterium]|nr:ABC transporter permease [Candidatus Omnitrophota bacterium]MDD5672189.1 ABC transporter permease [Candidatus Omnitrophota bacterium]
MRDFFGKIGETSAFLFAGVGRLFDLFASVVRVVVSAFYQKKVIKSEHVFHQMVLMGVDSLAIICLVGSSVGMVLALQAAYQLKLFGAVIYTGSLVSVSMARELGPLIAAIVITGRVGARMAAELGTMTVQEEVDALTTMGLNPIRYLVVPRCIALMVMLPCLTVVADVMGMLGGFLIGTIGVHINPYLYLAKNFDALVLKDIYTGLSKSGIFALLIALVSCHQGLSVEGGAEGVGKATTQAVVISIILIIVVDCLATAVFYYAIPT